MKYFLNERQNALFVENTHTWIILIAAIMIGAALMAVAGIYLGSNPLLIAATGSWLTGSLGLALCGFFKGQATLRQLHKDIDARNTSGTAITADNVITNIAIDRLMNDLGCGLNDEDLESLIDDAFLEMGGDRTDADNLLAEDHTEEWHDAHNTDDIGDRAKYLEPAPKPDPEPDTGPDTSDDND